MAELTLCMIVRDEERMLAECLASARGAVDRMVIVDTGSSDGTHDIIRRFGAERVDYAWNDDFAAARNAGLDRVESGYVLILDADERLTSRGARVLRAVARKGIVDLGMLPLHHATSLSAKLEEVLSGQARRGEPQLLPRLLRRTPDLRYEGLVHESVGAWARNDRHSEVIAAPIVHYGAAEELRAVRKKNERNRELLRRRCELEPDNPTVHAYLAAELDRAGESERALEMARKAWNNWQSSACRGERLDVVLPATLLGQLALRADEPGEARAVAAEALACEEHPNLHLLTGVANEQAAFDLGAEVLASAATSYERCLALAGVAYASEVMPGATSWQAATRLGTVRLREGRPELARDAFRRALLVRGDLREAQLGLVEATLECGELDDALALLAPLLSDADPDAWLLAGRGALQMGSSADALLLAERARSALGERSFVAPHRKRALATLERSLSECESAREGSPSASRETCVFAWPRYDESGDLDMLLGEFGKLLAGHPHLVLCLRHDSVLDGDVARAEACLERAFVDHLGEAGDLRVVLLDGNHRPGELAAPRDIAVELPHTTGVRRRFLEDLGVRNVDSPAALRAELGVQH